MVTDTQMVLKHFWKKKINLELWEKELFSCRSHSIMTECLNHYFEGIFPEKLLSKSKHSDIASGFESYTENFASSAYITCQKTLYWNQQDDSWIKYFLSMSRSSSWSLLKLFLFTQTDHYFFSLQLASINISKLLSEELQWKLSLMHDLVHTFV